MDNKEYGDKWWQLFMLEVARAGATQEDAARKADAGIRLYRQRCGKGKGTGTGGYTVLPLEVSS